MRRIAMVLLVTIGFTLGFGLVASVASAQDCPVPDIADFIDPVTGDIDIDAYNAALVCDNGVDRTPDGATDGVAGAQLARTGSNTDEVLAAGFALIVVGAGLVVATRRRAKEQV